MINIRVFTVITLGFLLPIASSVNAQLGSFTLTNLLNHPVEATFSFVNIQAKKTITIQPNDTFHIHWLTSSVNRRLAGFTLKEKNNAFPAMMTGSVNVRNEGVYAVGAIKSMQYPLFSFNYAIHKSAVVFGGSESITMELTGHSLSGSYKNSCKNIVIKGNEMHAICAIGPQWHEGRDGYYCNHLAHYKATFIGIKALAKATFQGNFSLNPNNGWCYRRTHCFNLGGMEKNLPSGTYLKSSVMASFDQIHHLLVAAKISNIIYTESDGMCGDITYFSMLDLTEKSCKDIIWDKDNQLACNN